MEEGEERKKSAAEGCTREPAREQHLHLRASRPLDPPATVQTSSASCARPSSAHSQHPCSRADCIPARTRAAPSPSGPPTTVSHQRKKERSRALRPPSPSPQNASPPPAPKPPRPSAPAASPFIASHRARALRSVYPLPLSLRLARPLGPNDRPSRRTK
ncbi:hypothetical protein C8F04DRAFT_1082497 [Mycena alexandri]|uniref:Uncharacterized protein n=1 Tax=Mycena alexandri TaxID=1745969 RepID=A0AAD6XCR3_9AGAR|nr:hypothetical protein C8F04DRAFT_1082497 [Mycena alexandri]